jgi:predicted DNA-binding ribbon-helix-helix protein
MYVEALHMHRTNILFSKKQWRALKGLAKAKGISAGEFVRRIADEYLDRVATAAKV